MGIFRRNKSAKQLNTDATVAKLERENFELGLKVGLAVRSEARERVKAEGFQNEADSLRDFLAFVGTKVDIDGLTMEYMDKLEKENDET